MAVKLLVSGLSNVGKTTLLKSLEDAYVVAVDGKVFPFPIAHTNFMGFASITEFTDEITSKIQKYNEVKGTLPKTVVIDSVSQIFQIITENANLTKTGFDVHSQIAKEVALFTRYLEETILAAGMSVVIISHAILDEKTLSYSLTGSGSFAKKGGFLSIVDNSIFLQIKAGKRIVHHRNPAMAARSTLEALPDSMPAEEYSLQAHLDLLLARKNDVVAFAL